MKYIYAAFWVFIAVMLLWQCSVYNHHIDQKIAATGPQQQHFFFDSKSSDTTSMKHPAAKLEGAQVKQVNFTVDREKPMAGNFTCHVTLKNIGTKKATKVLVQVSPFRGIVVGDEDAGHAGHAGPKSLSDSDPAAQICQWIDFPDLAPGQTMTKDVTFTNHYLYAPGSNPNPVVKFETAP